jgi:hypothetical protein
MTINYFNILKVVNGYMRGHIRPSLFIIYEIKPTKRIHMKFRT